MVPTQQPFGLISIFLIFLKLGIISFGGPIAHLGYFRGELVSKRKWLSDHNYAEIVSLCQFLPGPTSSQVGMVLGYLQKGYAGALVAWLGFTLPSAIFLILLAYGVQGGHWIAPELVAGLKILTVAIVIQAISGMAKSLCPDLARFSVMLLVAALLVLFSGATSAQVFIILLAGLWGILFLSPKELIVDDFLPCQNKHRMGFFWIALFFAFLLGLIILNMVYKNQTIEMIDLFYRAGSLVFGGGHVVLPLLQAELAPTGWVGDDVFLAGYGATQLVPGPIFTFAAFLGASIPSSYPMWVNGLICLVAIFAPSFFLVMGALPFWNSLRKFKSIQAALMGVNAAVVGILLAALYDPILTHTVHHPKDIALSCIAVVALMYWRLHVISVAILIGSLSYLWQFVF